MKKIKEKVKDITEGVSRNLNMMRKANFYKMSNLTHKVQSLIRELMKLKSQERYLKELMKSSLMLTFSKLMKKRFQRTWLNF